MNFTINPCRAVMLDSSYTSRDINTMNDLCYEISHAYGNVYGANVEKNLNSMCANMMFNNGHNNCYLKRPSPPPIFNQVPHYYPSLLATTNNSTIAYTKCCEMANKSRYPQTSLIYCRLDHNAIEPKSTD